VHQNHIDKGINLFYPVLDVRASVVRYGVMRCPNDGNNEPQKAHEQRIQPDVDRVLEVNDTWSNE
jgi:hypothetical protein